MLLRSCLDLAWILLGSWVDLDWILGGSCLGLGWAWILRGSCLYLAWVLLGYRVDLIWILLAWILPGSCLDLGWILVYLTISWAPGLLPWRMFLHARPRASFGKEIINEQKSAQYFWTGHFGQAMLKTCMPANLEPLKHRYCHAFCGYVILVLPCWPMNHGWFMGRHPKTNTVIHKYVNRKTYANPYWIANKIKEKRSESIW